MAMASERLTTPNSKRRRNPASKPRDGLVEAKKNKVEKLLTVCHNQFIPAHRHDIFSLLSAIDGMQDSEI